MRVICLDIGERRIGVAVSDLLDLTAQGVETIWTKGIQKDAERVRELCRQYETTRILCGLPLNMDGSEGQQAIDTREFGDALHEYTGLPIYYVDERLTSASAHLALQDGGLKRKDHKAYVDKVAAVLILQTYMQNPARYEV